MNSKGFFKFVLIIFSVLIGIWHLGIALKALFVFRNNESLLIWIFILFGPLSTFPATLASFRWVRIGGFWLILGGIVSLLSIFFLEPPNNKPYIIQYFFKYSSPMILLGLLALIVRGRKVWPYN
jgi:hypothetical protein